MIKKDYYKYYEILFSLRKEYLKNQEIINKLLSYIKITDDLSNKYHSNIVFKKDNRDNTDYLLLIISKRQSHIKLLLDSIYNSIVYSDLDADKSKFTYDFHLSDNYVSLLDANQDGRYLNSKIIINNQKEFIELYKNLIEKIICKNGNNYFNFENKFIKITNNGINLLCDVNNNHKNDITLYYDGIVDNIKINNSSYIKTLMEFNIKKDIIPTYFRNLIDSNMDDYLYSIIESNNKKNKLYKIEDNEKKLVLRNSKLK